MGNAASGIHKYLDEHTPIIVVNVPLTVTKLAAPMSIWQVYTFALLSPDHRAYYTELTRTPKFIIYNSENKYYAVANDLRTCLTNDSAVY